MDTNNALAELKDVHLPPQISIFPLAIGWYIVIAIVIILIGLLIWWMLRKRKQQTQIKNIYQLLTQIEQKYKDGKISEPISEVSILVKRIAIMKFAEQQPHALFGEKWLAFLDLTGKTNAFSSGAGKNLLNIYQRQQIDNPDQFFAVIRQWMGKVL